MQLNFKRICWETVKISSEKEKNLVLDAFKNNKIKNASDLFEILAEEGFLEFDLIEIQKVGEQLDTNFKQDGHSTIELYNDNNKLIWQNGRD